MVFLQINVLCLYGTICHTEPFNLSLIVDVFVYLQLYRDHDIKNVVESAYKVDIADWPKFEGPDSESKIVHNVRPFRCIGKFIDISQ